MIRFATALSLWLALAVPAAATVDIEEFTTPGGTTVWLVEEPSIPFVALEIAFRGGTSLDAEGKRGATNLMTALLEEGSGELDAAAFAAARDDLAASFRFNVGDDALRVSARFLSETTEAAGTLLADALARPRFEDAAVARVRAQVLSRLRSQAEDPNAIATDAFTAAIYGEHPYATSGEGTADSVAGLTREDLLAAHGAAIARDRVYVAAAGDIDADTLGALVDRILADLPESGPALPGPVAPAFDGGVEVINFPTPQAVVAFGQPGIGRDDPDFFAAFVLNHILGGGGFGSRLTEEVRVRRGLTYGIYSYLAIKDQATLLAGRVATANATAGEAIDVIRAEWERMAETGPTVEELDLAKQFLIGGYPLRFDGNASIARILVGMQLDNREASYVQTRNDQVAAVTPEDVRRVAAELLDPASLSFVVVGQPEGLAPGN